MAKLRDEIQTGLAAERTALQKLTEDYRFQLAQSAVDVAGIFDPTPVSDLVGAGMSLASGDLVGAGLSLVSIVPYVGDALGKTAKGARAAAKIEHLRSLIKAKSDNLARLGHSGMEKLKGKATELRSQKKKEAMEKAAEKKCVQDCPKGKVPDKDTDRYGTNMPKEGSGGSWKGDRGNSDWMPEKDSPLYKATDGKPVTFKEGHPDFSEFVMKDKNGMRHEVEIPMTGNNGTDFKAANEAMAQKLGQDKFSIPEGYTWHHKEDGVTMQLVPRAINNPSIGGVPHDGGGSFARNPEF